MLARARFLAGNRRGCGIRQGFEAVADLIRDDDSAVVRAGEVAEVRAEFQQSGRAVGEGSAGG